jgi:hypothetical protein
MAVSLSANVRNRRKGRDNHTDREGPQTTQLSRSLRIPRTASMGQEEPFQIQTLSDREAPIADLPAPPGTGTLGQKAAVRRVLVEIWAVRGPKTDVSRAADQQLGVALNRQEGRTSRLLAPIGK